MLPWDDVPEGYCAVCEGFTTNYDHRGECREHGVAVTAEIPNLKEDKPYAQSHHFDRPFDAQS